MVIHTRSSLVIFVYSVELCSDISFAHRTLCCKGLFYERDFLIKFSILFRAINCPIFHIFLFFSLKILLEC